MKIKLTIFILFLSLSFSIGLKALVIPQSASLLSTSGTGISNNYQVNPALLLNEKNHVSFSKNIWLLIRKREYWNWQKTILHTKLQ